jgi:hypothetical protein
MKSKDAASRGDGTALLSQYRLRVAGVFTLLLVSIVLLYRAFFMGG